MINLKLVPVIFPDDEQLDPLIRLYTESFPPEERRSETQLKLMIGLKMMDFIALHADSQLSGFLIWWNFVSFGYIEHFAVFPKFRGSRIGTEALQQIRTKAQKTLLEADHPFDEMSERRIGFYRRNGFEIIDKHYIQPPYLENGTSVSMYLLSDFYHWREDELDVAVESLRKEVYFNYH